jgi:hypothetical protein
MYLARFSYDVAPANRERALEAIRHELGAARKKGLEARLLIPITRAHGSAALQFEVGLTSLDQLEEFRNQGVGSKKETGNWMHAFSEILLSPPVVEILRIDGAAAGS